MTTEIKTLEDLGIFIGKLNADQAQQTPKVLKSNGEDSSEIYKAEITEEPFLINPENEDQFGYPSELKKTLRDWEIEKFKELEPVGTVILYLQ